MTGTPCSHSVRVPETVLGRSKYFSYTTSLWAAAPHPTIPLLLLLACYTDACQHSLAYVEMRLVLTRLLWEFDIELVDKAQDWTDARVFLIWEKKPLSVRLKRVR